MTLGTSLLDLTNVVALLSSFGAMSGLLSVMRIVFLDRALARLDAKSQNVMLVGCYNVLNFAAIVGLSLALGAKPGAELVVSSLLATLGAGGLGHVSYTGVQYLTLRRFGDGVAPTAKTEPPVGSADTALAA